jgi:hypothetical protein
MIAMFNIRKMLVGWSPSEQREILYFLIRYFKQSPHIEEGGKDIFDDIFARSPSVGVREATIAAVEEIKASIGTGVSDLSEEQAGVVLTALIEIVEDLEIVPSNENSEKAAAFFERFS